jgi:putative FmdB family regulatory protein
MPLYEYQCQNPECTTITETFRSVSDREKPFACPKCGKAAKKKISKTSFTLKGGGWASDGYGS